MADDLMDQAMRLHLAGRHTESEALYRQIPAHHPDSAKAKHYLGFLLQQMGRLEEALEFIEASLQLDNSHSEWHYNHGIVLDRLGRCDEAIAAFEHSLKLAPGNYFCKTSLGALLEKSGDIGRAEQLYREASQIDPHCPDAHYLLASLLVAQGRFLEARHSNSLGLIADPARDKSKIKLGIAYCEVGERDRAIVLMENWLHEEPGNPVASHMMAAFRGDAPERCSERYVEAAFDRFAAQFDSILTRLDYAGPRLLREELQRLGLAQNSLKALDLGCGTGLNGRILKSVALSLTGVDISQAMLDAAGKTQCYDFLVKSEICEFLCDGRDRFDLISCMDTLIYFGNLEPVFSGISARLAPGGQFVFTTEKLASDSGGYELGITGRYRHSEDYVARLLDDAGFELSYAGNAAIRKESGQPVEGQLYSARKRR